MAVAIPASTTLSSYHHITLAAMLLFSLMLPANGSPTSVDRHSSAERSRDISSDLSEQLSGDDIRDISVSYFSSNNESSDNSGSNVTGISPVNIFKDETDSLNEETRNMNLSNSNIYHNNDNAAGCPKCRTYKTETAPVLPPSVEEQETVRKLRLEMVKAQILSKLGLEVPPAVERTQPLPDAVTSNLALLDTTEPTPPQERESTKIILAKTRVPCPRSSPRHAVCFVFPSSSHLWPDTRKLSSAGAPNTVLHLWLSAAHQGGGHHRRSPHVTVTRLYGYGRHRHHHLPGTSRQVLSAQAVTSGGSVGWVQVNLTQPSPSDTAHPYNLARRLEGSSRAQQSMKYSTELDDLPVTDSPLESFRHSVTLPEINDDVVLEVTCRHCAHRQWEEQQDQDKHQPFLAMQSTIRTAKNSRSRRSAQECSSSVAPSGSGLQSCCRESMYISFSELGWDDWIIQPAGFTLYYCKGSCSEPSLQDALRGGNTYDGLLQRILLRDNLSPSVRAAVAPCCSAQNSEPLSIIWLNSGNSISMNHLPNMVVTQCGCSG